MNVSKAQGMPPRREEEEHKSTNMELHDHTGTPNDVRLFPAAAKSLPSNTSSSIRIAQSTHDDVEYKALADYREYLMAQRMQHVTNHHAPASAPTKRLVLPDQPNLYDLHMLTGGGSARDRLHRDYQSSAWKQLMPRLDQDTPSTSRHVHFDESAWNMDLTLPQQDFEEEDERMAGFSDGGVEEADGVFELDM